MKKLDADNAKLNVETWDPEIEEFIFLKLWEKAMKDPESNEDADREHANNLSKGD